MCPYFFKFWKFYSYLMKILINLFIRILIKKGVVWWQMVCHHFKACSDKSFLTLTMMYLNAIINDHCFQKVVTCLLFLTAQQLRRNRN